MDGWMDGWMDGRMDGWTICLLNSADINNDVPVCLTQQSARP